MLIEKYTKPGMLCIRFYNNGYELVRSAKLSKSGIALEEDEEKKEGYIQSYFCPVIDDPVGTLLLDFIEEVDFDNQQSFNTFIDKWGFSGLVRYSQTLKEISDNTRFYPLKEYEEKLEKARLECRYKLQAAQVEFKNMIYYYFDADGPQWTKGLTPLQRYFLISNLPTKARKKAKVPSIGEHINNLTIVFETRSFNSSLDKYILYSDDIDIQEISKEVSKNSMLFEEYFISDDIVQICYAELKEMMKNNYIIKKCGNCNKYFTVIGKNKKYCRRSLKDDTGRTCQDVGPMRNYSKKEVNPITEVYRTTYKTMFARRSALGPTYEEEFVEWKEKAQDMLKKATEGTITHEEFTGWLKNSKTTYLIRRK